ncbi:MAG: TonB-dependent receptor [Cyclobacteriaceae bacterium]|nr:TonB-dependent receptor [Cyclobacteriaceae bacterium SS2]
MHSILAQSILRGRIIDAANQEPLESSIVSAGPAFTLADENGSFSIEVDSLPVDITVNHLGYFSQVIRVSSSDEPITIPLGVAPTQLHEVIVSASQQNESLKNASASIGVITRKGLERDDQTIIAPALNRIPGVYMHSGSLNTNRITIRGIGGRTPFGTDKIRAYFDQIPLTSGVGETTLEDIDLSLIERVEVIKGPNSSIYGAGLGGVINLKPVIATYQKTSLQSGLVVGSYGLSRWVNKISFGGNHSNFSLAHSKMVSDGYRDNNEFQRESIGLVGRVNTGKSGHLSVVGNYIYLKSFIPSSINQSYYDSIPSAAAPNWAGAQGFEQYDKVLLGLSYTTGNKAGLSNTSSVFVSYRDAFEPRPRPLGILKENTVGTGFRNIVRYRSQSALPWSVSGGMEYFRDTYKQQIFENLYQQNTGTILGLDQSDFIENRDYYNLFVQTNFDLSPKLSIEAGANFNETNYQLKDLYVRDSIENSGDYHFDPVLSPRIGVVYHSQSNRHYYGNISHGFSPPNLEETLNPDGAINPDIQPEMGWNYEVGTRGYFLDGKLQYDANLHYMLIKDLIVSRTNNNGAITGINAGKTRHLGVELTMNYTHDLNSEYQMNYFITGAFMNYEFLEFLDGDEDYSGNELTGTPKETVNMGVELISRKGLYGNINGQYTGDIPIDDGNTLYADSYFVGRAKVGYLVNLGPFQVDLHAGINNIFDAKYASMLQINNAFGRFYYPGMPRNYFGGATAKWSF